MSFSPIRVIPHFVRGLLLPLSLLTAVVPTYSQTPADITTSLAQQQTASHARVRTAGVPLAFEPNLGQMNPSVKYAARTGNSALLLTDTQVVFMLPKTINLPASVKSIAAQTAARKTGGSNIWSAVTMQFAGSRPSSEFVASAPLSGTKNYFIGKDKTKWAKGVPLFSRVVHNNVYDNIDIDYRSAAGQLEFDFVLHRGAKPQNIALVFQGTQSIAIAPSGDLILSTPAGELQIHRPAAYQVMPDGTSKTVSSAFKVTPAGRVQLTLGDYDPSKELVIDPAVTYATYLGGAGQDEGLGIAVDSSGNMYVAGATASADFPNTNGGLEYQGGLDSFVTKFTAHGQLVYSTLMGGSGDDVATAIAVADRGPNRGVFVVGYTNSDNFPALINQYFLAGIQNAFVYILDIDQGILTPSSTYLGGEQVDAGLAITVDTFQGYVFVAGQTTSQTFPISSPLFNEGQLNMGAGPAASDAFVAELYPDLSGFYFSTYLGGANNDFASGIALDHPDSTFHYIYVTGGTNSGGSSSPPSFYTTPGVLQSSCGTDGQCNNGKDDAFVTVLCTFTAAPCDAQGLQPNYVYSTFLGGSGTDDAYAITADANGNAYVTGRTQSTDFKTKEAFQGSLTGAQNAFVAKLSPDGTALQFSTYLGGSQTDAGLSVGIDNQANVYVMGRTTSPDFPLYTPTQATIGGGSDGFVISLVPTGNSLNFSTFIGGSGDENVLGGAIAIDASQNAYITGDTNSSDFPTQNPYQGTIKSTQNCTINGVQALCPDAYIARLNVPPPGFATLMVTVDGGPSGALGSVSSSPAGIDQCSDNPNAPGVCTSNFSTGTIVTLTATPLNDQFAGWSGDVPDSCGTNLSCEVQIEGNMNVTATFNPVTQLYSLSVQGQGIVGSSSGTGTVTSSPAGINCGTGGQVCQFNFAAGTQVTLAATADSGSFFYGWAENLACSGTGPCTVVMDSNQTVGYIFLTNGAPPPLPDFTLKSSSQSLGTIAVGSQGVTGISIVTLNGFTDVVNLSCSVLPADPASPSCSVDPTSLDLPINGGGSATLVINTSGLVVQKRKSETALAMVLGFPLLATFVGSIERRKWRLRLFLLSFLLAAVMFQIACGSSGGARSPGGLAKAGNYTVVVNAQAMSSQTSHTIEVGFAVQ